MKKAIPYLFWAVYVTAIIVLVIMIVNHDVTKKHEYGAGVITFDKPVKDTITFDTLHSEIP